jgi:uncharacterized membrane protein YfcA
MLAIIGYLGALFMGTILGLIGGGGSIIALPIFVYLFGVPSDLAIVYSLLIVGSTSVFASWGHVQQKQFDSVVAVWFGAASVVAVVLSRYWIVPNLPDPLLSISGWHLSKDLSLLLLFAGLMLLSAFKMIFAAAPPVAAPDAKLEVIPLIMRGLAIGLLTGLIGAGGGFLIVPALVYYAGLPMKKAVGTSLLLIGVNSLIGFATSLSTIQADFDWVLLSVFLGLGIIGTFIGASLAKKIPNELLKPAFGWFVLSTGTYIIIKEIFFK